MTASQPDDDALRFDPVEDEWEAPRESAGEPGFWLSALFGGFYLVWGVGWVIGLANQPAMLTSGGVDAAMFALGQFLAYIAAPLWFVAVIWLGSEWSLRRRFGSLLLGLIVLVPWPLILPVLA